MLSMKASKKSPKEYIFILPIPPSSNGIYINNSNKARGGRSLSKRAKAWKSKVKPLLAQIWRKEDHYKNIEQRGKAYNPKTHSYRLPEMHKMRPGLVYEVIYEFFFEKPREVAPCDIFNFEKLLSDSLVDVGLMLDDSFIDKATVIRHEPCPNNPHVKITLKTLDPNDDVCNS